MNAKLLIVCQKEERSFDVYPTMLTDSTPFIARNLKKGE